MARLEEVGERDSWRCWLCDEAVDPKMSVNDARGPSIDSLTTKSKSNKVEAFGQERLAHRSCNTRKGAIAAVVSWPAKLYVADPAPIVMSVDRLHRKGGREVMARCPTGADGRAAAEWLLDRVNRLAPDLAVKVDVESGGGQFLVVLRTS